MSCSVQGPRYGPALSRPAERPPASMPSRQQGFEPALVTFHTFRFKYDESKCVEAPFLLLYTDKPRVDPHSGLPYARVDYEEPVEARSEERR